MSLRNLITGPNYVEKDPYFKNVSLLLSGDSSTNGGQNNTFLDSSSNTFTITRNGNVTQGSFSPFGDRWSNYFNGSSSLRLTTLTGFDFSDNSNFTIEFWVNLDTINRIHVFFSRWHGGGDYTTHVLSDNYIYFNYPTSSSSTNSLKSGTPLLANTWYHIAVVRNGSTMALYLNGTLSNSQAITNFYNNGTTLPYIGEGNIGSEFLLGCMSNLRVIKGTALYTSNFTPPTSPLTAVSGTVLLTCQSNRFIDNSTYANTITVNGTPSVQKFSPFSPVSEYNASVDGGSAYFDGSGDYISTTDSVGLGSGNFTIEGWFYKTGYFDGAFSIGATGATDYAGITFANGTGIYYSNTGTSWTNYFTVPNTINQWNHIAFVRNGTTITAYVNGVSVGSGAVSGALANKSGLILVGVKSDYMGNGFPGYISNFRIVKGTALYTSNFTPPTSPLTNIPNTQLLCNFTNGNIIDSSLNNDLETVGNAQISTSVKKYGTGSMYFDGSGDYLQTSSPNLALYAGDFTIEMWVYFIAYSPSNDSATIFDSRTGNDTSGFAIGPVYTNTQRICVVQNASPIITPANTFNLNTWIHIALVRNSTTLTFYIDGINVGQITNSTNNISSTNHIGNGYWNGPSHNGYLDDLRITKGIARYTANFTPPTAPLPKQ